MEIAEALQHGSQPMWIYDLKTLGFLEVNAAAVNQYGYSREEFLNMTILDIRPSEDIKPLLHTWKRKQTSQGERWKHIRKDGTVFVVSITSRPVTFQGREAELVIAEACPP
jgi:PAS domain S-box-containing protein